MQSREYREKKTFDRICINFCTRVMSAFCWRTISGFVDVAMSHVLWFLVDLWCDVVHVLTTLVRWWTIVHIMHVNENELGSLEASNGSRQIHEITDKWTARRRRGLWTVKHHGYCVSDWHKGAGACRCWFCLCCACWINCTAVDRDDDFQVLYSVLAQCQWVVCVTWRMSIRQSLKLVDLTLYLILFM